MQAVLELPRYSGEGFEGAELHVRERPIPGTRQIQRSVMRCRPGTFEWRYGRGESGTPLSLLYQAGVEFSGLWERAGMDGPGTVDWAKAGSPQWRGLPDARVVALDDVKEMSRDLGKLVTARLVHYCVQGKTSTEIGMIYDLGERATGHILESDLMAAAQFFRYVPS
jgi:hypothetical protein